MQTTITAVAPWPGANAAWLAEGGLVVVAVVVAMALWLYVAQKIKRRTDKSETQWDDLLLRAVNMPMLTLILAIGAQKLAVAAAGAYPAAPGIGAFFDKAGALLVVATLFWMAMRVIDGTEKIYLKKTLRIGEKQLDEGAIYGFFRMARAVALFVAGLAVINNFGVSISGILAFGGIGGIVIGFAARDTLANYFAGLLIFVERPFVIGDWIRCPSINLEGVVEKIGWRMTKIRTFDRRPLYTPNGLFFGGVIENAQRMTHRRIYEYMGLRYDDVERLPAVLEAIRAMLQKHENIDQSQILMVAFDKYGASSLDFFIYAMTKTTAWSDFHKVKEDVLLRIAAIVRENNCEFAFPTRTVHHHSPPPPAAAPPAGGQ